VSQPNLEKSRRPWSSPGPCCPYRPSMAPAMRCSTILLSHSNASVDTAAPLTATAIDDAAHDSALDS